VPRSQAPTPGKYLKSMRLPLIGGGQASSKTSSRARQASAAGPESRVIAVFPLALAFQLK
jgi:hypothetical protein